jgi:Ca2+-binding RTX toxin-like protein
MTTLTVTATTDYTGDNLTNIDTIVFDTLGFARATFSPAQFGPGLISDDVVITGDANINEIQILTGSISAAGWTFNNWTSSDIIDLEGSSAADTITGSIQNDDINGNGGADTIDGGDGDDSIFLSSDNFSGASFEGGAQTAGGFDRLSLNGAVSYHLNTATISGIEHLDFTATNESATLSGDQIGGTGISQVDGNTGDIQSLIVSGGAVNLSTVTFSGWGGTNQTITINASGVVPHTLVGSTEADTINGGLSITPNVPANTITGGGGADTLNGNSGADVFRYAAGDLVAGESVDGQGGTDTLQLFNTGNIDFSIATLSNLEALAFMTGTSTATFTTSQFGAVGIDQVTGSSGTDGLVVEGTSVILTNVTFSNWTAGVDKITILGTSGDDQLNGSGQNDTLNGGAGNDVMQGGTGDDTYFVDSANDHIEEIDGQGSDQVFASVSYTLDNTPGHSMELLATTDDAGTTPISLKGNDADNTIRGNAGDNTLEGLGGADILVGLGGDDTYHIDDSLDQVVEAVGGGFDQLTVITNYTLTAGAEVELLTTANPLATSGFDITGNEFAQTIEGDAGANTLNGGGGADTLQGFGGDDTYLVDNPGDQVIEATGGGTDHVLTSVSYTLGAGQEIESFTPTSFGSTTNINLTGNALAQSIFGNAGNNLINDGGAGGSDTLEGLTGDDTYIVNNAGDHVFERAGEGSDHVLTSVSYTLDTGSEIEVFNPTSFTSTAAINLTGNALAQTIYGNAGANLISDGGAGGADTLEGLGGDDTYIVNNIGDHVFELAGGGADHVLTSVSYTLGVGASVETLTPTGFGTTTNINLTGNTLAQSIFGNAGNNIINDGGAGGNDTLEGFAGDDTYIVNNSGDHVFERAGDGNDHVLTSVDYTLDAGSEIERFNPTSFGSATNLSLTGNTLAQTIIGNAGNNIINDGGPGAPDTLEGLSGNDTYIVNNSGDHVFENASDGSDLIRTSVSYTLDANSSIEAVNPTNFNTTTDINLTGNALGQSLAGNAGDNVIDGKDGEDTLAGGGGQDTFVFDTALNAGSNVDQITDFVHGTDKIELDHHIFTALNVANPLDPAAFTTAAPSNANQHIIYNATTGALSYDDDGNGAHAAVQFATLSTHPALASTDLFVA